MELYESKVNSLENELLTSRQAYEDFRERWRVSLNKEVDKVRTLEISLKDLEDKLRMEKLESNSLRNKITSSETHRQVLFNEFQEKIHSEQRKIHEILAEVAFLHAAVDALQQNKSDEVNSTLVVRN